jgi:hypothetical protein
MTTHKALTVRQPWAWLIVNGYKPVEYRTWQTHHRGELYIIASQRLDAGEIAVATAWAKNHGVTLPEEVDCGGIVGKVTLDRVSGVKGDYEWHLSHATPLPFVACKGGLGILTLTD